MDNTDVTDLRRFFICSFIPTSPFIKGGLRGISSFPEKKNPPCPLFFKGGDVV